MGAFALVLADEAALADQEGVAALHAELLSSDPTRPTLRAEAWKLIERWGSVPVVSYHVVEALLRAHGETERPIDREHTTPYIVEHPDWFPSRNVRSRDTRDAARFRHVVDYIEDLVAVNAIDEALRTKTRRPYGHREIISLLEARPDIVAMNAMHVGDSWQRRHAMALVHREPVKGMHHARTRDIEDRRLRG